jgi:uncharacterized protein (DUF885 family)
MKSILSCIVWCASALLLSSCKASAPVVDPATHLNAVMDHYIVWRLQEYPEWATAMGDHTGDARLRDMTPAAVERRVSESRKFAGELEAIDATRLTVSDRVDRAIVLNQIALDLLLDTEMPSWRLDPLVYTNLASDSVYDLIKRDFAPLDVRLRSAISRMRALPRLLQQARANLTTPTRIKTEIAIGQTDGAIDLFRNVVNGAAKGSPLAAEVSQAADVAATALEAYREWLASDLLPRSKEEWRVGAEAYDRLFALESGSTMAPLEALRRAEADFLSTRERLRERAVTHWAAFKLPGQPPADADTALRRVLQAMSDDHPAPDQFIPALQRAADDLKRFIRDHRVLELPEPDTLTMRPTPDFQAGLFHGQLEQAPPLEKDGASIYTTSGTRPYPGPDGQARMIEFLREFNSKALVNLITHEGYPGHYVQGRYAARSRSRVRKLFVDGANVEGWACYGEWMMLNEGFGNGDAGLEMQMLKMQLKLISNTMLDIKLHRGLMREEDVVPFLIDQAYQTPGEARSKLTRAKGTIIQLTTYYLGYREMRDLRDAYQQRAGASFDLAEFHRKVLDAGAPPMRFLRQLVLE